MSQSADHPGQRGQDERPDQGNPPGGHPQYGAQPGYQSSGDQHGAQQYGQQPSGDQYGHPQYGYQPSGDQYGAQQYGGPQQDQYGQPYGAGQYGQPWDQQGGQGYPPAGQPWQQPAQQWGQPGQQPWGGQQGGYGGGQPGYGGYGADQGQQGYGQPYPQQYGGPQEITATLSVDDGSGRSYQLQRGSNVLGRGQDAAFRLPDTSVSRRHVDIYFDGHSAVLHDLGSTNGTTVNGSSVQTWQLADGDVIHIGHSTVVYSSR